MQRRILLPAGTVLQGRYRIIRHLGQGGMGAVYEAENVRVSARVALKETFAEDDYTLKAFEREAKILANLTHEAFPRVMDYFAEGEGCYLVMELVRGTDLAELLEARQEPFEIEQVLEWTEQIFDALEYLHSKNIIHRDIKPSNIKLTPHGRLKLLDFGIAKGAVGDMTIFRTTEGSIGAATLQYAPLEQVLLADPHYYAVLSGYYPEQVEETLQQGTDARSDLFALAATVYQLLTKHLPVNSPTRALAVWSGQNDKLRPAHEINPRIPIHLSNVLRQSMELRQDMRPASADEMRRLLVEGKPEKEVETVFSISMPPQTDRYETFKTPKEAEAPPPSPPKPQALNSIGSSSKFRIDLNSPNEPPAPEIQTVGNRKFAPRVVASNSYLWWIGGAILAAAFVVLFASGSVLYFLLPRRALTKADSFNANVENFNSAAVNNLNSDVTNNGTNKRATNKPTNTTVNGRTNSPANANSTDAGSVKSPISPQAENLMKEARAFLNEKQFDKAIESYTKVIAIEPGYDKAYLGRGSAYTFKKDNERAVADLTRATELNPNVASAHNNLGVAHKQKGNYDRAIAAFNKAIELAPENASYYQNRANAYQMKGDKQREEADRKRAKELAKQ